MTSVNISKQDFNRYRIIHPTPVMLSPSIEADVSPRARRTQIFEYDVNPHHDFRNYKSNMDYLYILFSSSNFLHSGPFFDHIDKFSPHHMSVMSFRHLLFYV